MDSNIRHSHEDSVTMPLQGKRILVTRAQAQAHDLEARLQALGAVPLSFPTIHITPPRDGYAALDAALRELATFDWVVFTSVNGRFVAEALLEVMPDPAGKRFLLPRAALARDTLRIGLQRAGAQVVEVSAYDTILPEPSSETLAEIEAGVDVLTFTASSTVRNFVAQLGQARARSLADRAQVAVIGPITAETARNLGLRVDVEASEYTIGGLVAALVDAYGPR
ncbi:Uroporphyrinogen-III synthase [Geodia barretti]|uniref:Uroporphyrinogen-III synthase n=1 Tax=Geodia barretti TaxID=519541 RepID=A0AA35U2Q0_GEOBA|nr:Uroporphyrinogen-III synthase [Geodia barretti]